MGFKLTEFGGHRFIGQCDQVFLIEGGDKENLLNQLCCRRLISLRPTDDISPNIETLT